MTLWHYASRLVAWAPDEARELLVGAPHDGDPLHEIRVAELLGRVFAVTGAWDLARRATHTAAAAWLAPEPARAVALRGLAESFPLAPFRDDAEALAAELELVRQVVDGARPMPVVRRAVVEIRRALEPRVLSGRLEHALALSPPELALLVAATAHVLDPTLPALPADRWEPLVRSSSLLAGTRIDRLVRLGAIVATPELVASPAIVSWLLGRTRREDFAGVRLIPIAPAAPPADARLLALELAAGDRVAVVVGPAGTGRRATLAAILASRGVGLWELEPSSSASAEEIRFANLEARLHGALAVVDLDRWSAPDLELVSALAPIAIVTEREPALHEDRRAFTLVRS